jgi:phosphopantothenoylcysteine decarboxylase/phosphopantothenate--cysteine ligase
VDLSVAKDQPILLAVTGGIAAYKVCTVVSRLAQAGAHVTVMMTESATRFVTPLTFQSLSGRPVYTSQWQSDEAHDAQHIALARAPRLMVFAPASTNTIAKLAHGICDNLVTTVAAALPRHTPVLLAPAMNAMMWDHPLTQRNLATLRDVLSYHTVGPSTGWQACRTQGTGRMAEPDEILDHIARLLVQFPAPSAGPSSSSPAA